MRQEEEATRISIQILNKFIEDRVDSLVALSALVNAVMKLSLSMGLTWPEMKEHLLKWTEYE